MNKRLPFAYQSLEHLRVVAVDGNVPSTVETKKVLRVTSQKGSALEFQHEDTNGRKVAIPNIEPLRRTVVDQVEKIYELPARHFSKEVYIAEVNP